MLRQRVGDTCDGALVAVLQGFQQGSDLLSRVSVRITQARHR